MKQKLVILEKGNIYFFYRPRVEIEEVHDLNEVQRVYLVLKGECCLYYRLIVVGKKQLPTYAQSPIEFAFVDSVFKDPQQLISSLQSHHYTTKTRGERNLPEARFFGEGKYILLREGANSFLVYQVHPHQKIGNPQKQMHLSSEGNWIVSLKNPIVKSDQGLSPLKKAEFPKELLDHFKEHKFIALDSADYLNYKGAELLLIAEKSSPTEKWGAEIEEQFASFPFHSWMKKLETEVPPIPTKALSGIWE